MRNIAATCCLACAMASSALAIPPREPIKNYKTYNAGRTNIGDATPSFSAAAQNKGAKSSAMPMGASGSAASKRYRPGSMLPSPTDYVRPQSGRPVPNNRPGYQQNYRPNYQQNYGPNYQQNYGPNYQQNYRPNYQQNYGPNYQQNYRPSNRPSYRPDNRPGSNRPDININVNNNTTVINRPGYGSYDDYASVPYYSQLHYHWRPSVWSQSYRPVFYNYGYSSVGGSWLSVGGTSLTYVNPFYVQSNPSFQFGFDYSQPIRVPGPNYRESRDDLIRSERAIRRFDDAREVFRRGEYGRASELIDEAIDLLPNDPTLHQFRALVLFARQQYSEASAVLYSVLAVSPGWDASTVAKLYDPPSRYLVQLNQLAQYAASHPDAIDAQFLLAYHYALRGDLPKAEQVLVRVEAARPGDQVVQSLITALRR